MRNCNAASLLDITSFAVSKYISNKQISWGDFEKQIPLDTHPFVMRFQFFNNNLEQILAASITGPNSDSIPASYVASLLALGANPNIMCDEKQTNKDEISYVPHQNSLLSAAILAGNSEHIKALATHPKTDLENECFQKATNLAKERPLIIAIVHAKEASIIETLIAHGANVNATSQYYATDRKRSALSLLCGNSRLYKKEEHFNIMKLLLDHGANPYSIGTNTIPQLYREETYKMVQKYYHL